MIFPGDGTAACPFCGCLCDDLKVITNEQNRLAILPHCPKAEAGFAANESSARLPTLEGRPVEWEQAFASANALVRTARQPLVLLTSEASCQAQAAGARLGRRLYAVLDTPASSFDSAWIWALAQSGISTGTLGRLSGKLLVLWGADLAATHPRWQSRYAPDSLDRTITIDSQPGQDIDLLRSLRRALKGKTCDEKASHLLQRFREAGGGVIFAGSGLAHQGRAALLELCSLCADLENDGWGRWEILPLMEGSNPLGAIQALLAECGFPASVRSSFEGVEFSPVDWSAEHVILSRWVDLAIWVGNESWLSPPAAEQMSAIQSIVASSRPPGWAPTLWLPVRQLGVDTAGTALRLDGVPVHLTSIIERDRWDMSTVLDRLGMP